MDHADRQRIRLKVQGATQRLRFGEVSQFKSFQHASGSMSSSTSKARLGDQTNTRHCNDTTQHARRSDTLASEYQNLAPRGHRGETGETVGGKMLRKPLPSCPAHHQPGGSSQPSTALTSQ